MSPQQVKRSNSKRPGPSRGHHPSLSQRDDLDGIEKGKRWPPASCSIGEMTPSPTRADLSHPAHSKEREREKLTTSLLASATCEKQILTPSNAILYCSEACRRKDSCKPLALAAAAISPSLSIASPPRSASASPRPILPPTSPTGPDGGSQQRPTPWTPADVHDVRSELDRAELQSTTTASPWSDGITPDDEIQTLPWTTEHSIASLASASYASLPSLTRTSTATSGSLSMVGSDDGFQPAPASPGGRGGGGTDSDFVTRPLKSRRHPLYSTSAGTTRGVELVFPHVAPQESQSLNPNPKPKPKPRPMPRLDTNVPRERRVAPESDTPSSGSRRFQGTGGAGSLTDTISTISTSTTPSTTHSSNPDNKPRTDMDFSPLITGSRGGVSETEAFTFHCHYHDEQQQLLHHHHHHHAIGHHAIKEVIHETRDYFKSFSAFLSGLRIKTVIAPDV